MLQSHDLQKEVFTVNNVNDHTATFPKAFSGSGFFISFL